jgi:hypothetical protein
MTKNSAAPACADATAADELRKPWAKPQVITASAAVRSNATNFAKSEPSITDYTTGATAVGS